MLLPLLLSLLVFAVVFNGVFLLYIRSPIGHLASGLIVLNCY